MQSIGVLLKNGGRRPPTATFSPKGRREESASSSTSRRSAVPLPEQRARFFHNRIGPRQLDLWNRLQRFGVIFRRRQRDVHFRSGRIGADDGKILARGQALVPGACGENGDVARRDLDFTAAVGGAPPPRGG